MALATPGSTTGTNTTGNVTLTSWTPVDGEYLLLGIATRNTSLSPSVAGNSQTWAQLGSSPLTNAQGQFEIHMFDVAVVSGASAGSIVVTLAGNTQPAACIAARFSGQHATPIEATATAAGPGVDDDDMLVSIATATANAWAIGFGSSRAGVFTVPGDESTISVNLTAGAGGDLVSAHMWYLPVASPATVEVGAANDLNSNRDWSVYAVALAEAAAAGGQPAARRFGRMPHRPVEVGRKGQGGVWFIGSPRPALARLG